MRKGQGLSTAIGRAGHSRAPVLAFLAIFVVLAVLADRTGYEGDDLNSVLPMLTLDAARAGLVDIYRYDWQPLSYQIGAAAARIAGAPWPIFLLPPLAMALALAMLYQLLSRLYGVPLFLFVCLVLLSPELLYSGLYYNSVALGYCAAVAALLLVHNPTSAARTVAIGCLLGISILLRLDFVLIAPAMLLLFWMRSGRMTPAILAGSVAGAIGLAALATGFVRLSELQAIYAFHSTEMAAMADVGGWNDLAKAFVASTILSPLGFLYYGVGSFWLLVSLPRRKALQGIALFLALLPALISLPDILSVKYMLPSYVFLPLLGGAIWRQAQDRLGQGGRWVSAGLVAGTLFLSVAAIDIDNQKPFVSLKLWQTRQIPTHDGARSWGAYVPQMLRLELLSEPDLTERTGLALADLVQAMPGRAVVFVGAESAFTPGAAGWRHAMLDLARQGATLKVETTGLMRIDSEAGGTLWLAREGALVPQHVIDDPATMVFRADDADIMDQLSGMLTAL